MEDLKSKLNEEAKQSPGQQRDNFAPQFVTVHDCEFLCYTGCGDSTAGLGVTCSNKQVHWLRAPLTRGVHHGTQFAGKLDPKHVLIEMEAGDSQNAYFFSMIADGLK